MCYVFKYQQCCVPDKHHSQVFCFPNICEEAAFIKDFLGGDLIPYFEKKRWVQSTSCCEGITAALQRHMVYLLMDLH